MGDTLADLMREIGIGEGPATRAARTGAPPPLPRRPPPNNPAARAYNERRRAPTARADMGRTYGPQPAFTPPRNQFAELPRIAAESTGLPSLARAHSLYTNGIPGDEQEANEQAIWGGMGVAGFAGAVPALRAPRAMPRPPQRRAAVQQPVMVRPRGSLSEALLAARRGASVASPEAIQGGGIGAVAGTAAGPLIGPHVPGMGASPVIDAIATGAVGSQVGHAAGRLYGAMHGAYRGLVPKPFPFPDFGALPDAPPRLTPPPREIGPNGMPIAPRAPFRNSLRGGSDDLAEAAAMRGPDASPRGEMTFGGGPVEGTVYRGVNVDSDFQPGSTWVSTDRAVAANYAQGGAGRVLEFSTSGIFADDALVRARARELQRAGMRPSAARAAALSEAKAQGYAGVRDGNLEIEVFDPQASLLPPRAPDGGSGGAIPFRENRVGERIYEPAPGVTMGISQDGTTLFAFNGETLPGRGTGAEAQRAFRSAYRALVQDAAETQRPSYRFRAETPRQAALYRAALSARPPAGYRFVESGQRMRLERIDPATQPPNGSPRPPPDGPKSHRSHKPPPGGFFMSRGG